METIALRPGMVIDARYRLDRWLGGGGMGVVWAATHLQMRHTVALKFVRPELASDPATCGRFLREARAAAAVRHPNVVTVHDLLENDGAPVIVMELLEGETLGQRLAAAGPLSVGETAAILLPVMSATGAAHARGIVHRDLKPDNIFLCEGSGDISRRTRVLDFGIAKALEFELGITPTQMQAQTQTGNLVGSPSYMSPEQVFCERDIDDRSDTWSLGVILYQCLTGIVPTEATSLGQTLKLITSGTLAPITHHRPDLPPPICDLVSAMLSRERQDRPDLAAARRVLQAFAPNADSPEFGPPLRPYGTREATLALATPSTPPPGRATPSASGTLRSETPPTGVARRARMVVTTTGSWAEPSTPEPHRRSKRFWILVGCSAALASVVLGDRFLLPRISVRTSSGAASASVGTVGAMTTAETASSATAGAATAGAKTMTGPTAGDAEAARVSTGSPNASGVNGTPPAASEPATPRSVPGGPRQKPTGVPGSPTTVPLRPAADPFSERK